MHCWNGTPNGGLQELRLPSIPPMIRFGTTGSYVPPAWGTGTPEGERASWGLVHFIRQLPTLTPEVIARMEQLNPKSPAQFREEEETRRFLAGEDPAPAPAVSTPTSHQGRHD